LKKDESHLTLSVKDVDLVAPDDRTSDITRPRLADAERPSATSERMGYASSQADDDEADDRGRPAVSERAALTRDPPKRGWVLPALAAAVAGIVFGRVVWPTPAKTESPATPPPAVTVAAASENTPASTPPANEGTETSPADTTATPEATPPAEAPLPTEKKSRRTGTSAAATPPAGNEHASDTPTTAKAPASPADTGLSLSDLLDRAGSARRAGEHSTARDLYQRALRQSPSNAEAHRGLGDIARAQGDLNAAKASYQRALATSPTYGPAQLGLADTEWDLGNRASAQRHYAQIVERLGKRAPERAKQRAGSSE
jgi:Flp pilus assembly protein TadD